MQDLSKKKKLENNFCETLEGRNTVFLSTFKTVTATFEGKKYKIFLITQQSLSYLSKYFSSSE